jgi:steroid delta-isomerase-like uncharacterized protein
MSMVNGKWERVKERNLLMNKKISYNYGRVVVLLGLLMMTLVGCVAPIQDTRSQTNIGLSAELHKNFSENNFDADLALADDNIEIIAYAFGLTLQGKEQFGGFMQGFKSAFPDLAIKQTNVVASGDQVVVEFEASGTHTGPLVTPAGEIPASGKAVKLNVVEVHAWQNGKLTKLVNYQDSASLLRQIGAIQ